MFRVVSHPSSGAHNTALQYLALMRPLLLPFVSVTGRELRSTTLTKVSVQFPLMPDTVDTVL